LGSSHCWRTQSLDDSLGGTHRSRSCRQQSFDHAQPHGSEIIQRRAFSSNHQHQPKLHECPRMSHIQVGFQITSSSRGRHCVGAPRPAKPTAPPSVPHITKLMALAIRLEHLLATGQVKDQAEIARTAGITRARVTQIINLTQLAPDIQEAILNLEPTTDPVPRFREREVRTIAILPNWEKQRLMWKRLVKRTAESHSSAN